MHVCYPFFTTSSLCSTQNRCLITKIDVLASTPYFIAVDIVQAMENNPRVPLSTGRSRNFRKQMMNPFIRRALFSGRIKNTPPKIPQAPPINTNTSMAKALRENVSFRALKVELVCSLRERNGSLKSGEQVMESYIMVLGLEAQEQSVNVGDTCLLLDPLLRTHESSVLGCFMKHHGLHRLHALLRRFCQHKFEEGRSVIRKILRILQHLENCEMLTVEHMTCHPPVFCVHKFCKLLLKLAEYHEDSHVRTLACSFQGLRFNVSIPLHPAHEKCWWWEQILKS